jgi:hypothetical protein
MPVAVAVNVCPSEPEVHAYAKYEVLAGVGRPHAGDRP